MSWERSWETCWGNKCLFLSKLVVKRLWRGQETSTSDSQQHYEYLKLSSHDSCWISPIPFSSTPAPKLMSMWPCDWLFPEGKGQEWPCHCCAAYIRVVQDSVCLSPLAVPESTCHVPGMTHLVRWPRRKMWVTCVCAPPAWVSHITVGKGR